MAVFFFLGGVQGGRDTSCPANKLEVKGPGTQQLQNTPVDMLWSAHSPHYEMMMYNYVTTWHMKQTAQIYFLEQTTGWRCTVQPQTVLWLITQFLAQHLKFLVLVSRKIAITVHHRVCHDQTLASSQQKYYFTGSSCSTQNALLNLLRMSPMYFQLWICLEDNSVS